MPTVRELIMKFFRDHPDDVFRTTTVTDWVKVKYHQAHGREPVDVSTPINDLSHEGFLIRVGHGRYKYRRS
ncbi:hypothetical protein C6503_03775 [Candidatus Poribacteria bacterium]|nr:MAG: hypothetical protein C6503_03775 [Candidatus Poribacteria bacterium]